MNLFNFLTDQIHTCEHLWHVVVYLPWDGCGNDVTGYQLNDIQRLAWADTCSSLSCPDIPRIFSQSVK